MKMQLELAVLKRLSQCSVLSVNTSEIKDNICMSVIMDQLKALILWTHLVLFLREESLISEGR